MLGKRKSKIPQPLTQKKVLMKKTFTLNSENSSSLLLFVKIWERILFRNGEKFMFFLFSREPPKNFVTFVTCNNFYYILLNFKQIECYKSVTWGVTNCYTLLQIVTLCYTVVTLFFIVILLNINILY